MKDLSVSHFKAKLAAYLREVQQGETLVITEHRRPVAEVRAIGTANDLVELASRPFTLEGSAPRELHCVQWSVLLDEERGGQ